MAYITSVTVHLEFEVCGLGSSRGYERHMYHCPVLEVKLIAMYQKHGAVSTEAEVTEAATEHGQLKVPTWGGQ